MVFGAAQQFHSPERAQVFADLHGFGIDRNATFLHAHERTSRLGFDSLTIEAAEVGLQSDRLGLHHKAALKKLLSEIEAGDAAASIFFRNQYQVGLDGDRAATQQELQKLAKRDSGEFKRFADALIDAASSRDGGRTGLTAEEAAGLRERLSAYVSGTAGEAQGAELADALSRIASERLGSDATFRFRLAQNLASPAARGEWAKLIEAVQDLQQILALLETVDGQRSYSNRFVNEHRPGLEALDRSAQRESITLSLAKALGQDLKMDSLELGLLQENKYFKLMAEALERFGEAQREKKKEERARREVEEVERQREESLKRQVAILEDKMPLAIRELMKHISPEYSQIRTQHIFHPYMHSADGVRSDYGSLPNQVNQVERILDAVKFGTVVLELSQSQLEALSQYLMAARDLLAERLRLEENRRENARRSLGATTDTRAGRDLYALDE